MWDTETKYILRNNENMDTEINDITMCHNLFVTLKT